MNQRAFTKEEKLKAHLDAGAKSVVLSAPIKEGAVPTYVLSVNAKDYKGEKLINNASCTTNCITPVAKVIVDNFRSRKGDDDNYSRIHIGSASCGRRTQGL